MRPSFPDCTRRCWCADPTERSGSSNTPPEPTSVSPPDNALWLNTVNQSDSGNTPPFGRPNFKMLLLKFRKPSQDPLPDARNIFPLESAAGPAPPIQMPPSVPSGVVLYTASCT